MLSDLMNVIGNNVGVWLAATIVALLTIFSDKILGRIRTSLNRADLRTKYFEQLAIDLSAYVFYAEIFCERFEKGWSSDPADMQAVRDALNDAMTTLRKNEYVYRSWVRRYWQKKTAQQFKNVMTAVKSVDSATHAFNDAGKEEEKTAILGKQLGILRNRAENWLSQAG